MLPYLPTLPYLPYLLLLLLPVFYLYRRRMKPVVEGPPPRAGTKSGQIEGVWKFSSDGLQFASFSGVPYAAPPVGPLRLLRPQPPQPWQGVRKCIKGLTFIQRNIFRPGSPKEGQEDALTLNVYTHNWGGGQALPVMVWLHGGGYVCGSGSKLLYGPELFMDRQVVVVSLNFRVSVLGGLYLPGGKVPGNQMMRDQVLGLQWVQENISSFGGDPSRVTIFGESAGAMSVMNHVLSPASSNLFHAAIAQSGSPLSPFVCNDKHPEYYSRKLAEKLGAKPGASSEEILELLQRVPAIALQDEAYMFEEFIRAPMPFKPIVDGGLVEDPFLPEEPREIIKKGAWNKVPLIIGTNRNEGLLSKGFYNRHRASDKYEEARRGWDSVGPLAFFNREKDECSAEESAICQEYRMKHFGEGGWTGEGKTGEALVEMYGDLMFAAPADHLVKSLTGHPDCPPVYHYLYSHQGPFSLFDLFNLKPWQMAVKVISMKLGLDLFPSKDGVCHADELFMMFKAHALPVNMLRSQQDRLVSKGLLDMWTNFATHHNPTPEDGLWKKFDPSEPAYLEISGSGSRMEYSQEHRQRMDEWAGIWSQVPPLMTQRASSTWQQPDTTSCVLTPSVIPIASG